MTDKIILNFSLCDPPKNRGKYYDWNDDESKDKHLGWKVVIERKDVIYDKI